MNWISTTILMRADDPYILSDWMFDEKHLTLTYKHYEIDLEKIQTSSQMLDLIFQVANKTWATDEVICDFIFLLKVLLNPQAHYCSCGANLKVEDVSKIITPPTQVVLQNPE